MAFMRTRMRSSLTTICAAVSRPMKTAPLRLLALMPTAYPAPTDGPVGELLRAAKRSPYRPAHIHFIVSAPGYETLVTQIFVKGDKRIEDDVVFTASENMVGRFPERRGPLPAYL